MFVCVMRCLLLVVGGSLIVVRCLVSVARCLFVGWLVAVVVCGLCLSFVVVCCCLL